ncbi:uncharacterized protein ARMOST_06164 [Armillaria ostoyae]|uniref:Uncharacterized protein n=1 Tax=Armillaria ostoyae TaxID=47428 RepID=A0A284R2A7_ARMOS|nr:uncharacterized protein ARMOST_06164 [Armillaria ostoyae]
MDPQFLCAQTYYRLLREKEEDQSYSVRVHVLRYATPALHYSPVNIDDLSRLSKVHPTVIPLFFGWTVICKIAYHSAAQKRMDYHFIPTLFIARPLNRPCTLIKHRLRRYAATLLNEIEYDDWLYHGDEQTVLRVNAWHYTLSFYWTWVVEKGQGVICQLTICESAREKTLFGPDVRAAL